MKLYYRIFVQTWQTSMQESQEYQAARKGRFNTRILIICVLVCLSLVFIEYVGKDEAYLFSLLKFFGLIGWQHKLEYLLRGHPDHQLNSLAYWVGIIFIFYFLIPFLLIKIVFKEKIHDYGIASGSLLKDYKLYLLMFLVMIPLIYLFSRTEGFQNRYPFYRFNSDQALWPKFWIWEILYLFQFFCLEFFFRGFMVHGLKKQFGFYSVFVMTIPYCMIHFGKPLPETIAAIIAGILLGTLSLKSRTIWPGVIIHYSVAIVMDLSALWQKGYWTH